MFASLRDKVLMFITGNKIRVTNKNEQAITQNLPTMILRQNYTLHEIKNTVHTKPMLVCNDKQGGSHNSLICQTCLLKGLHGKNFRVEPRTSFVRKYSHPVIWRTVGIAFQRSKESFKGVYSTFSIHTYASIDMSRHANNTIHISIHY